VPNLTYTFADALSELLPRMMPEVFTRRDASGALLFAAPGHDVTSYDYLRKLSKRQAPLTDRWAHRDSARGDGWQRSICSGCGFRRALCDRRHPDKHLGARCPIYTTAGLAAGALLGFLGLKLTRWEHGLDALHYTPNRPLVLGVTSVAQTRVVYGFWRSWESWQPGCRANRGSFEAGVPDAMGAGAVWLGVRRQLRRHVKRHLRRI
jgi:hypothetical protein